MHIICQLKGRTPEKHNKEEYEKQQRYVIKLASRKKYAGKRGDGMNKWYINKGPDSDVVLSSRVRLARNFVKYPFPHKTHPTAKADN